MAKTKLHKFSGVLETPIRLDPPPREPSALTQLADDQALEKYEETLAAWRGDRVADSLLAHVQRWRALSDRYGVDLSGADFPVPDPEGSPWERIAWGLAREFVPGFEVKTKLRAGAPRKWTGARQVALVLAVRAQVESKTILQASAKDACRALARKEPWKGLVSNGTSLYQRYQEALNNPAVQMAEEMSRLADKAGDKAAKAKALRMLKTLAEQNSSTEMDPT